MNPHRKGNAFINKQVPGDPRLLDQLHRQQVRTMGTITHTHSGTLIGVGGKARNSSSSHPWKVSINGDGEAVVVPGRIYDSLMSGTELTFTNSLEEALIGDVVCLKYTYATEAVTVAVMALASYSPTTVASSAITESFHIIASLIEDPEDSEKMITNQMARNHLALVTICKDGEAVKTLVPL